MFNLAKKVAKVIVITTFSIVAFAQEGKPDKYYIIGTKVSTARGDAIKSSILNESTPIYECNRKVANGKGGLRNN